MADKIRFIAELPLSKKPWQLKSYQGILLFFNEEHGLFSLDGDKIVKVKI